MSFVSDNAIICAYLYTIFSQNTLKVFQWTRACGVCVHAQCCHREALPSMDAARAELSLGSFAIHGCCTRRAVTGKLCHPWMLHAQSWHCGSLPSMFTCTHRAVTNSRYKHRSRSNSRDGHTHDARSCSIQNAFTKPPSTKALSHERTCGCFGMEALAGLISAMVHQSAQKYAPHP